MIGVTLPVTASREAVDSQSRPASGYPGAESELARRPSEMLFQVLTEREETATVAIASDESFSGWTKTFTDPRLCAAIVDRLTFAGNIIDTGTESYRLAHARAARAST
jgi:DNA replication protein DnaC